MKRLPYILSLILCMVLNHVHPSYAQTIENATPIRFTVDGFQSADGGVIEESLEATIVEGEDFRCDIKLLSGHKLEYKNWKYGSLRNLEKEKSLKQLKAYIESGDFEYIFSEETLKGAVKDVAKSVRKKFQKVFKEHAEEFYSANPAFFEKFKNADETPVNSLTEFEELVKDKSFIEQLSNIVKVE